MTSLRAGQPLEFSLARTQVMTFLALKKISCLYRRKRGLLRSHRMPKPDGRLYLDGSQNQGDCLDYIEGWRDIWSDLHMDKGTPYQIQFHSVYPTPERYRISIIHRSKVPG